VKEDKFIKKDHPEWEDEKKMEKVAERCHPDLLSWWLKPVAENRRQ
jgi:hypothetical protein